jgi:hypothetical protein
MEIMNQNFELALQYVHKIDVDRSLVLKITAGSIVGFSFIYLGYSTFCTFFNSIINFKALINSL